MGEIEAVGWRTINPCPAGCEGDNAVAMLMAKEAAMSSQTSAQV